MSLSFSKSTMNLLLCMMTVLLVSLAGCLTTPVSSMVKLSRMAPLDAKAGEMRFAVRSPNYLRVRNGDISVTVSYDTGDPATSFVESYRPVVIEDAVPGQGIAIGSQDGTRLSIARFSPEDSASMTQAQRRVKELRAAGIDGQGSFAVGATGCLQGRLPDGPIMLTTWLQTDPADDYFVLTRNIDLRTILIKSGQAAENIPLCDNDQDSSSPLN